MEIENIKPYDKNAKVHPEKQLKKLAEIIAEIGWRQPVLVNQGGVIVAGHGRYETYKRYRDKYNLKPIWIIDDKGNTIHGEADTTPLSEEQEKAYRLADNKLNESQWNMEIVIDELKELNQTFLDLTGFDSDLVLEPEEKDDDIPEDCPTVAKLGDIWQLGNHRIICGDSTSEEDVKKLMEGKKANMVFTDPPYNVDYKGGGSYAENGKPKRDVILNDKMTKNQFFEFLSKVCKNLNDNCIGAVYICMASSELDNLKIAYEENGGHWSNFIIWLKNTFTLSRSDYQHQYEPILYGWPDNVVNHYFCGDRDLSNVWQDLKTISTKFDGEFTTIKLNGVQLKLKGEVSGSVMRKKQKIDIWRYNKPSKSSEHPTMKPVALVTEAIVNSSKVGDIVLDLFLGNGSTLIACEKTNRICYGMELDPKYVDVIIQRYEQFAGQPAEKIA